MKASKTSLLFIFSILLVSCFESPEFGDAPHIEFKRVYFGLRPNPSAQDSLVIELEFEDGDGDLGLGDDFRNFPFHEYDLFLYQGNDTIARVRNVFGATDSRTAFVDIPEGANGKLLRFDDIAPNQFEDNCNNYRQLVLLVEEADKAVFDETYSTVPQNGYYQVQGKFQIRSNPRNKNIFVNFYKNESTVPFEFPSCQNFHGRFPLLSDDSSPLSGTLRYSMSSLSFRSLLGNPADSWQLEIFILDRLGRKSNVVRTKQFKLAEITQ